MKFTVHKNLNQRGFLHHIIPIVAFVALFAVIGAIFYLRASRAATPLYYIESTYPSGGYCLSNVSGTAKLELCSKTTSAATLSKPGGVTTVKINGQCLSDTGSGRGTFSSAYCAGNTIAEYLNLDYPAIYQDGTNNPECYGAVGINGLVAFHPCGTAYYKTWKQVTVPATTTSPPPTSSAKEPCVSYQFYSGEPNTWGVQCVKDLQGMLYAVGNKYKYAGHSGSGINPTDGEFGTGTITQVKDFQKWRGLSQDGTVGKNTWTALCSYYKSASGTGSYYSNAGCATGKFGNALYP